MGFASFHLIFPMPADRPRAGILVGGATRRLWSCPAAVINKDFRRPFNSFKIVVSVSFGPWLGLGPTPISIKMPNLFIFRRPAVIVVMGITINCLSMAGGGGVSCKLKISCCKPLTPPTLAGQPTGLIVLSRPSLPAARFADERIDNCVCFAYISF